MTVLMPQPQPLGACLPGPAGVRAAAPPSPLPSPVPNLTTRSQRAFLQLLPSSPAEMPRAPRAGVQLRGMQCRHLCDGFHYWLHARGGDRRRLLGAFPTGACFARRVGFVGLCFWKGHRWTVVAGGGDWQLHFRFIDGHITDLKRLLWDSAAWDTNEFLESCL